MESKRCFFFVAHMSNLHHEDHAFAGDDHGENEMFQTVPWQVVVGGDGNQQLPKQFSRFFFMEKVCGTFIFVNCQEKMAGSWWWELVG